MTKTEVLELIRNGENSGVEFKRDTLSPFQLAKELVALANLYGGRVLLGVESDGTVCGLTRADSPTPDAPEGPQQYAKLEEWVMSTARDKIRPELIPYFEVIREVETGKDVAVIQIDSGWTVHHRWHENHRTYYIRVGTQSREASPEELERLFQARGNFRLELRPVSGAVLDDLDLRRLVDYFRRIRDQDIPPEDARTAWQQLLENTEFMAGEGTNAATVAGVLLFGRDPGRFLPQSGIDAAAYEGREKDYAAKERTTIRGPMTPLWNRAGNELVETGIVEKAIEFVRRNTRVEATLQDGARRVEKWTYPAEAVREAIVNALVHRDYLLSASDIELSLYDDRLEIISPGRLPNGITPNRMKTGCRAARNQLLKDVMRDYGYLEHMGMGVPRKIVKGMLEHNGTEPDLIEEDENFLVRLWNKRAHS